jgi:hypothetical protein
MKHSQLEASTAAAAAAVSQRQRQPYSGAGAKGEGGSYSGAGAAGGGGGGGGMRACTSASWIVAQACAVDCTGPTSTSSSQHVKVQLPRIFNSFQAEH